MARDRNWATTIWKDKFCNEKLVNKQEQVDTTEMLLYVLAWAIYSRWRGGKMRVSQGMRQRDVIQPKLNEWPVTHKHIQFKKKLLESAHTHTHEEEDREKNEKLIISSLVCFCNKRSQNRIIYCKFIISFYTENQHSTTALLLDIGSYAAAAVVIACHFVVCFYSIPRCNICFFLQLLLIDF